MPITNTQRRQTKRRNNPFLGRSSKVLLGHVLSFSFLSPSGVKSARLSFKSSLPSFFSKVPLQANRTSPLSSEMMMHSASEISVMPTPARWRVPHSFGKEVDLDKGRRAAA